MKALIVSDIHGCVSNLKKVISDNPEFDYLICAGDFLYEGESAEATARFLNKYNIKIMAACGNCDRFGTEGKLNFPLNEYTIFPMDGKLVFLTHGHLYNKHNLPNIDFDIYIQGHTHVPEMILEDGILYLNPGSISYPRGGSDKTYIYCSDLEFELKTLEEAKVLKKIDFH